MTIGGTGCHPRHLVGCAGPVLLDSFRLSVADQSCLWVGFHVKHRRVCWRPFTGSWETRWLVRSAAASAAPLAASGIGTPKASGVVLIGCAGQWHAPLAVHPWGRRGCRLLGTGQRSTTYCGVERWEAHDAGLTKRSPRPGHGGPESIALPHDTWCPGMWGAAATKPEYLGTMCSPGFIRRRP